MLWLGLDGATFTVLEPLMQAGLMPCLADLAGRGAGTNHNSSGNAPRPGGHVL